MADARSRREFDIASTIIAKIHNSSMNAKKMIHPDDINPLAKKRPKASVSLTDIKPVLMEKPKKA